MAKFATDGETGFGVTDLLFSDKRVRSWSTGRRRRPAREFLIALLVLGIGVPESVQFREPDTSGMTLVDSKLFNIVPVGGDQ